MDLSVENWFKHVHESVWGIVFAICAHLCLWVNRLIPFGPLLEIAVAASAASARKPCGDFGETVLA